MNWKNPSRHKRHPAEGQFGICKDDLYGPAEDLAGDSHWRSDFWRSMLGKGDRRAGYPHRGNGAMKCPDDRDCPSSHGFPWFGSRNECLEQTLQFIEVDVAPAECGNDA